MKVIETKTVIKQTFKLDEEELKNIKNSYLIAHDLYYKMTDFDNNLNDNEIDKDDIKELKDLNDCLYCLFKVLQHKEREKEDKKNQSKELVIDKKRKFE